MAPKVQAVDAHSQYVPRILGFLSKKEPQKVALNAGNSLEVADSSKLGVLDYKKPSEISFFNDDSRNFASTRDVQSLPAIMAGQTQATVTAPKLAFGVQENISPTGSSFYENYFSPKKVNAVSGALLA